MDGAAECIFIWCKESESKTNNSKNIFFYIDCEIFLSSAQAHSKYIICYVMHAKWIGFLRCKMRHDWFHKLFIFDFEAVQVTPYKVSL